MASASASLKSTAPNLSSGEYTPLRNTHKNSAVRVVNMSNLATTRKNSQLINTGKQAAANQSIGVAASSESLQPKRKGPKVAPIEEKKEEPVVAAFAAPSESLQPKRKGPKVAPIVPIEEKKEDSDAEKQEDSDEENDTEVYEPFSKYKYDPELGTLVSSRSHMIMLLKNALKELESNARREEEQLTKKYPLPKTILELLFQYVLHPEFEDPLSLLTIQFEGWTRIRSKTSMFEALWNIIIGLGYLPGFPIEHIQLLDWRGVNKERAPQVIHVQGNSSKTENIINVFKHMSFGTSASGVSDITFLYHEKPENKGKSRIEGCSSCEEKQLLNRMFISSVKFFELDMKKKIENFDIAPLLVASDILTREQIEYKILLFVKDANAVSNIVENARKRYLSKVDKNHIFGESHLKYAITKLREDVNHNKKQDIPTTIHSMFGKLDEPKSYLSLRFHQELMVEKTHNYVSTTQDRIKQVLIGVLPRGGKTYICGGIVSRLKPNIVLVLTHVPKETHKQFLDDLFDKFADFSDYRIVYLKEEEKEERDAPSDKMIIFTSYQLIKMWYAQKARERIAREMIDKIKSGEIDEKTELDPIKHTIRTDLIRRRKKGEILNESTEIYPIKRAVLKGLIEKTIVPDMCFFDEAHFGNGGTIAQEVYQTFEPHTVRVLMTATYIKPYYQFQIQPHQLFHWDYEDIQLGKNLMNASVFKQFRDRHVIDEMDTIFDRVLDNQVKRGNNILEIQRIYSKFPNIELITTQFEEKAIESFQGQLLQDSSRGISMDAIFAINQSKKIPAKVVDAYSIFTNPQLVGKLLNYIGVNDDSRLQNLDGEDVPYIEGDVGSHFNIMDRIYQDSDMNGNRLIRGVPHTQIWFIPPSNGIQRRIIGLASMLLRHPWFNENFCVMGIYGGESDKISPQDEENESKITIESFINGKCFNMTCGNSSDLKECIEKEERDNRCTRNKGTIILTGFMLRMGISLGCADVVMLLDDDNDPDATIQKTFRALTESEGKKKAYVVDLNPRRSIHAVCQHIRGTRQKTEVRDHAIYQTVINTFGINTDRFLIASPGGKPVSYHQLFETVQGIDQSESSSKELRKLEDAAVDMTGALDDQDISGTLFDNFKHSKLYEMHLLLQKERASNNNSDNIGKGMKRYRIGPPPPKPGPKSGPKQDPLSEEVRFNIFKNIIKTTLNLMAFTYESKNISEVYDQLSKNTDTQELVYDTLIKRGLIQPMLIMTESDKVKPIEQYTSEEKAYIDVANEVQKQNIMEDIVTNLEALIDKKINYTYRAMKSKANDPSADQQEILKYIDKYLAPTAELKDEYGEVFTPMWLVNEMLDKLEEAEPSIFKNKNRTWFDPANGMGNFPVAVFYRLMKQLSSVPLLSRAEHIVKNMLYMMEYRKENSAKCKRIFNKLAPDVEPNMITADSLEMTYEELREKNWPIHFDVIMGNPPYNPPKTGTGSSGNTIWPNFVAKSNSMLKSKGYLLFVHPPGWKKPTEDDFKEEKFSTGNYTGQIRQGQIWNILKENGIFKFIYTNDQRVKTVGKDVFIPHFPAVDYYVYQKDGNKSTCNTKNIFYGEITEANSVRLNYNLNYLPNLITKQSQDILHKVTSNGGSLHFSRGIDERDIRWSGKDIKWFYNATKSGFNYKIHGMHAHTKTGVAKEDTVHIDKVIINFGGGIDAYHVIFVSEEEEQGVLDKSMYIKVNSKKEGKHIESLFNSDIIKFIFLITQYASGAIVQNEPLVANSIEIPPEDVDDYYKFFGIQEHKQYIEDVLAHYTRSKEPKRLAKTEKKTKGGVRNTRFAKTRKRKN